jgi:hypothetical protein
LWRYPEEICNKHIGCELEPCLPNVRVVSTLPITLLSEQALEVVKQALEVVKWLGTHCLHSMECVHHVGLDVGVLSGPA